MNIVLITTGNRPELLRQSMASLIQNAANVNDHTLTVVCDGRFVQFEDSMPNTMIVNTTSQGASACRNIGAGSIPRYRRKEHVLFVDDDVYMCSRWDEKLTQLAAHRNRSIISGYCHPYNGMEGLMLPLPEGNVHWGEPLLISTVAMMMPWKIFDEAGSFVEPGGPGGSEDYAFCMAAKDAGCGFAVTEPQCVIHTGMMSSGGKPIVGYRELGLQNDALLDFHNIRGRVIFQ